MVTLASGQDLLLSTTLHASRYWRGLSPEEDILLVMDIKITENAATFFELAPNSTMYEDFVLRV